MRWSGTLIETIGADPVWKVTVNEIELWSVIARCPFEEVLVYNAFAFGVVGLDPIDSAELGERLFVLPCPRTISDTDSG